MDERTLSFYSAFAADLAQQYEVAQPEMEALIGAAFRRGERVLDVGAGSGRDMAFLLKMGRDAYGLEPCEELRALALARHPRLAGRLGNEALPHLGRPFGGGFDGVLCSGVLNHLPGGEMPEALGAIRDNLKDGGRLLLTVPMEPFDVDEDHRDSHGRLVTPLHPEQLLSLLEGAGFRLLDRRDFRDPEGRRGCSWCGILALKPHASGE